MRAVTYDESSSRKLRNARLTSLRVVISQSWNWLGLDECARSRIPMAMSKRSKKTNAVRRNAVRGTGTLEVHRLGAHPLIEHFLNRLDVTRILDKHIHSNRKGILSHGKTIAVLVHNILTSGDPMYRLSEWVEQIEPSALELTHAQMAAVNDDRVARALDQLSEFGGRGVFFQLALRCIKIFRLETSQIHFDTTSITFTGQYRGWNSSPRITHGYNKDHRPDLKQLVFGVNVTADGAVPLSHEVYAGNRSDDSVHRSNVHGLRDLLARDDFIYVADSKLCTKDNLRIFEEFGGRFVTVLPRTRKEDREFREELRHKAGRWRKILIVEDPGGRWDRVHTYSTCAGPRFTEDGFRLVWIRSSSKAEQDEESRLSRLDRAHAALHDLEAKLNRRRLKTRKQIKTAVEKVLSEFQCQEFLRVDLVPIVLSSYKRLRPGRPSTGDPTRRVSETVYSLNIRENSIRLRQERNLDGVFPLITNLRPKEHKALDVLQIYRYQPYLERRFQNLKTEYSLPPAYLKKPSRIVGLIHVHFIALMVSALVERELRRGMVAQGTEAIPLYPEDRECKAPTAPRVFELFDSVDWFRFVGDKQHSTFPVHLSEIQEQVIRLLRLPKTSYQEERVLG